MEMHTPSEWTFWLSVVLVILAIMSAFVSIPFVSQYTLWAAVFDYAVLLIGCRFKTT